MGSTSEFQRDYTRSRTDVRLANSFLDIMNQRFSGHTYLAWPLYPYTGQPRAVMSEFELGRQFWTHTYLYFPMPEGGIHKQDFSLLVTPRESDQTFVVRFKVIWSEQRTSRVAPLQNVRILLGKV